MHPSSSATDATVLFERQALTALRITRYAAFLALFPALAMFTAWILVPNKPVLLAFTFAIAPIAVTSFLFPYLYRRGLAHWGKVFFIASIMLLFTLTPLFNFDYFLTSVTAIGAVILLSFVLFGGRMGMRFAVVEVGLLAAVMLVNEYFPPQWFPSAESSVPFYVNLITTVLAMTAIVTMARVSFSEHENAYAQLQQFNQTLEVNAGEANLGRVKLEEIIQQYDDYMDQVSEGNLMAQLALNGHDRQSDEPILALGISLSRMTANLHSMILKIKEASQNVTAVSTQILAANTEQVAGATQTSASVAQTSTTVEELRSLSDHLLALSGRVTEAAQRTVEVSQAGQHSVTDIIQAMLEIRARVEGIAESILALSEKSQQIGEIITMVSDVAAQSNMLALNASIEASRAGEAGKGFGVVAGEMRSLAEQSRKATEQVKVILSEIQGATNSTVMATEEGSKVVERGVKLAESAQRSIEHLAQTIDVAAQTAQQMSAGGRQQLVGVEQVATTMQHINQATLQQVASSRQTENAARNLNELAQTLVDEITRYNV